MAVRHSMDLRERVIQDSDASHDDRPGSVIAAQPDATLNELRATLRTTAGLATIWRAINHLDLTVKENGSRRRTTAI
jgi:hypothetical protein